VLGFLPRDRAEYAGHHPARRRRQVQRATLDGSDLNPVRIRDLNDPFEIPHIPVQAVGVPAQQSIELTRFHGLEHGLEAWAALAAVGRNIVVVKVFRDSPAVALG
jgi:hypothetical protein